MMPPLKLPEFSQPKPEGPPPAANEMEEEGRIASYEEGYAAGWEDAAAAQAEAEAELALAVSQHLRTLSFSYQDARRQVLQSLEPLLMQATEVLLPEVAKQSLPSIVAEALMPIAGSLTEGPIRLRIAPEARLAVERHLLSAEGVSATLIEDQSLSGGQVFIESGPTETCIDLDSATVAVTQAVRDFLELQRTERNDG